MLLKDSNTNDNEVGYQFFDFVQHFMLTLYADTFLAYQTLEEVKHKTLDKNFSRVLYLTSIPLERSHRADSETINIVSVALSFPEL